MSRYEDWKNQPATEKQLEYIRYIQEFAIYPLPKFTGTTKGEAALYIDTHWKSAYKDNWATEHGYD